uniref:Amino acid transporter transmembrane domain-containing protein n=1 Tax=Plectus sambesii TaxID=2011161 RepID=A0A914XPY3_9BILA
MTSVGAPLLEGSDNERSQTRIATATAVRTAPPVGRVPRNRSISESAASHSPLPSSSSITNLADRQRRPFHYAPDASDDDDSSLMTSANTSSVDHNMAIRYRLFNRLDPGGNSLRMPDHVVPAEFFSILPFSDFTDDSGKQNSIVTIFSIWNTMMGTSLLAMPWALYQAGLGLGLFLMLAVAALALYTAYRIVESPQGLGLTSDAGLPDFPDVCRYFWGRSGELFAVVFSIVVLLGGVIVYWVLMSNFLYYTGTVFYNAMQENSTEVPVMVNKTWTCDVYCLEGVDVQPLVKSDNSSTFEKLWKLQGTVPFYLAVIAFPLLNFKSPTFFTKFNMLGTISVVYLLGFVLSKVFECGINLDFSAAGPGKLHHVELASWRFPALTGTLALSYFIHNAVLNILRNQKNPSNNARDLTIGYCLAAFCYVFVGFGFYAAFPTFKSCISDNFLNNFGSGDVLSAMARLFLLFQMFTVLPLLMYLIRAQLSYSIVGLVYPGFGWVCLINAVVMSISILFAVFFPHVGSILRYVGSFSGLIYLFALPSAVHLKRLQMKGELTRTQLIVHGIIVLLGVLNLLAQFALV